MAPKKIYKEVVVLFRRTKKGFAIVLTLAMLACMIPSVALASNTLGDDEAAALSTVSMELNSGRLHDSNEAVSLPVPPPDWFKVSEICNYELQPAVK